MLHEGKVGVNKELYAEAFRVARTGVDAFAKHAAPLYKKLGWKWSKPVEHTMFTPDEDDIRRTTQELLDSLESYGKAPANTGTGRIWVAVWNNTEDDTYAVRITLAAVEVAAYSGGTLWVSEKE